MGDWSASPSVGWLAHPWSRPTEAFSARWQCRALVVNKALSLDLKLTGFCYFSIKKLPNCPHQAERVEPVPDPILPEHFLGYSRGSDPGPLGWQSNAPTIIPNRRSHKVYLFLNWKKKHKIIVAYFISLNFHDLWRFPLTYFFLNF